jgi:hypothetical protein
MRGLVLAAFVTAPSLIHKVEPSYSEVNFRLL